MRLFGTDGIRAPFGEPPLDRATVTQVGVHLAEILSRQTSRPTVIFGGDTRDSTPQICRWLAAGLDAGGAVALFGGVLPTPAVATLVRELGADAGVAVSASHNPHPYNGIKLFDPRGFKWSPRQERQLEELIVESSTNVPRAEAALPIDPSLARRYLRSLRDLSDDPEPLAGLRIVLDAAHGAASPFARPLFRDLGAEVIAMGAEPNGLNINAGCGSTQPETMAAAVVEHRAQLGVAFDGDADRAILADERGQVRDGDAMLFAWARDLMSSGRLQPPRIVATSMSNLGLERGLESAGISIVRCDVGDRTVVTTMLSEGIQLGGEQSGHIVDMSATTTGDGLVTALKMATLVNRSGKTLSDLLADFRRFPQILRNVEVKEKPDLMSLPRVSEAAAEVEDRLGKQGRLVLRYSGTEPLARIMIEGPDMEQIESLTALLESAIRDELGIG